MKFLGPPSSGSIAGTTSSHNRAGQYTRNRRSPVQPVGSGRRAFVRAALAEASTGWAALSDPEREAWTSFAAGHPITDSLGSSIVLTGQQMFVRCGTSLLNVGEVLPTTPPEDTDLPDITGITFTIDDTSNIEVAGYTGVTEDFIAMAFSRPVSAGVSFMKTFWQPLGADGFADPSAPPYAPAGTVYRNEFGDPVVGQKVFLRATPVNEFGWNGTPIIIVATVIVTPP